MKLRLDVHPIKAAKTSKNGSSICIKTDMRRLAVGCIPSQKYPYAIIGSTPQLISRLKARNQKPLLQRM